MTTVRDPDSHQGAKVNDFGQLSTEAVTNPEDRHINIVHNKVWSLPFIGIDPVGADDIFFYIKNTDSINYVITDVRAASTVVGDVDVIRVSGTPAYTADADVTAVNRFLGSSNEPGAIIKTDTDTTGLTDEGVLFFLHMDASNELNHLRTTAGIVIPPGQAMALRWGSATGVLKGIVSLAALV